MAIQMESEYQTIFCIFKFLVMFVIQAMIWIADKLVCYLEHHLNNGPFNNRTKIHDLNTRKVHYSDLNCKLLSKKTCLWYFTCSDLSNTFTDLEICNFYLIAQIGPIASQVQLTCSSTLWTVLCTIFHHILYLG